MVSESWFEIPITKSSDRRISAGRRVHWLCCCDVDNLPFLAILRPASCNLNPLLKSIDEYGRGVTLIIFIGFMDANVAAAVYSCTAHKQCAGGRKLQLPLTISNPAAHHFLIVVLPCI